MWFRAQRPAFPDCAHVLGSSLAWAAAAAVLVVGCLTLPARGAIVVDAAGTSAAGNPVAFRATLAITGDELVIDLENISPAPTSVPADLLASFYFDIVRDGIRPVLDYRSAVGQVVAVQKNAADRPVIYTPPPTAGGKGTVTPGLGLSDLMATKPGDFTWQLRQFAPAPEPRAGFGLGTVGNSTLAPSNFDPKVVDGGDFAIYRGDDIEPKGNLPGTYLAHELVRFRFCVGKGWTEADIVDRFTFGLGTSPDSMIVVSLPEPPASAASLLVATGVVGCMARQAARRVAQAGRASASGTGSGPPTASGAGSLASSVAAGLACSPISRDTNTAM